MSSELKDIRFYEAPPGIKKFIIKTSVHVQRQATIAIGTPIEVYFSIWGELKDYQITNLRLALGTQEMIHDCCDVWQEDGIEKMMSVYVFKRTAWHGKMAKGMCMEIECALKRQGIESFNWMHIYFGAEQKLYVKFNDKAQGWSGCKALVGWE